MILLKEKDVGNVQSNSYFLNKNKNTCVLYMYIHG